jgi:hypothetical protein
MKRSSRGVVLVTVLWSISLLSALAMAASVTFRGFVGVMMMDRNRVQGDALLTVAFLVLWSASIFVAGANAQSQDQPAGILANPLQAQLLDRLSATRDRPLFSPSRRPPPPPPPPVERVPEAAAPPPPPNVTLFGIVVDGDRARAIVSSGTGKMARVQIGDDVGEWKVSQIEGRRLVLALDGRLATFTLFSREGDPTAKAADKLHGQRQQGGEQQMSPQAGEPQPATPRKRRRARE